MPIKNELPNHPKLIDFHTGDSNARDVFTDEDWESGD